MKEAINSFVESPWFLRSIYMLIIAVILFILIKVYMHLRDKMIDRLVYSREFSERGVYETENVILTETIYNNSWLPLFFVNIEGFVYNELEFEAYKTSHDHGMQYFMSRFHLMPHVQTRRHHVINCKKRGYYKLETVECYHNKKTRYFEAPADIYIYPKIIAFDDVAFPSSMQQGESISKRRLIADPFQLSGVRDYRFGDPFNSINFKATAKSGSLNNLRVNNREFCSNRIFMVYLNFQIEPEVSIPTDAYIDMMEHGLSTAAAILREAAYNGYRAGFAANCCLITGEISIKFPISGGAPHMEEILREMAKVRAKEGISFTHLIDNDMHSGMTDTEIFVLTSFMDDKLAEQFANLEMFGNYVNMVKLSYEGEKEKKQQIY